MERASYHLLYYTHHYNYLLTIPSQRFIWEGICMCYVCGLICIQL